MLLALEIRQAENSKTASRSDFFQSFKHYVCKAECSISSNKYFINTDLENMILFSDLIPALELVLFVRCFKNCALAKTQEMHIFSSNFLFDFFFDNKLLSPSGQKISQCLCASCPIWNFNKKFPFIVSSSELNWTLPMMSLFISANFQL